MRVALVDLASGAMRIPVTSVRTTSGPRWLLLCAVVLSAWIAVLGSTLGSTATVRHWDVSWIGLDALEVLGLVATAALLRRRHPAVGQVATATATLLATDAWFDVTLSQPGWAYAGAVTTASLVELPLAFLCLWTSWRAARMPLAPRGWPPDRPWTGGQGCRPCQDQRGMRNPSGTSSADRW